MSNETKLDEVLDTPEDTTPPETPKEDSKKKGSKGDTTTPPETPKAKAYYSALRPNLRIGDLEVGVGFELTEELKKDKAFLKRFDNALRAKLIVKIDDIR
jgi:hypothetical protein